MPKENHSMPSLNNLLALGTLIRKMNHQMREEAKEKLIKDLSIRNVKIEFIKGEDGEYIHFHPKDLKLVQLYGRLNRFSFPEPMEEEFNTDYKKRIKQEAAKNFKKTMKQLK